MASHLKLPPYFLHPFLKGPHTVSPQGFSFLPSLPMVTCLRSFDGVRSWKRTGRTSRLLLVPTNATATSSTGPSNHSVSASTPNGSRAECRGGTTLRVWRSDRRKKPLESPGYRRRGKRVTVLVTTTRGPGAKTNRLDRRTSPSRKLDAIHHSSPSSVSPSRTSLTPPFSEKRPLFLKFCKFGGL